MSNFKKALQHNTITEVASTEDMLTRPQILKHLGLGLGDFPSHKVALEFADKEVAKNKDEFGHEGKVIPLTKRNQNNNTEK